MDKIIFGDNQFFGVSHMSEERGMEQARRFQDDQAIIDVIDTAYDCGIRGFTFSTHDRVRNVCDHFRAHPQRYADLRLYPALPYAHKYANAVAEKGVVGAITDVVFAGNTAGQAWNMITTGGSLLLNRDPVQIMKLLVDAEMKMFRGLKVEVVFLLNIVTDLLMGMRWGEMLAAYARYVESQYQARAGFITLNMPALVEVLDQAGVKNPIICAAINKVGFQMNPDVQTYEQTLRDRTFQPLAMSVLAAGALAPDEALAYIGGLPRVRSVVFGASSRGHIESTRRLIEQYCRQE